MSVWTVFFDIDGTLMTSSGAGMGAMEKTARQLYGVDNVPDVPVHGRTDQAILHELFEAIEVPHDGTFDEFNEQYCKNLSETLKTRNGRLLPGVLSLLEHLSERENVAMGVLTGNLEKAAEIKLRHIGVDHFFNFGGYGDQHHDRNDVAAEAVDSAKTYLQEKFEPQRAWVIGDTPNDVRCGRHINAKVVAVQTGGCSAEELADSSPDFQFADLTQVDAWTDLFFG